MDRLPRFDAEILEEDVDLEGKRATGKHGRGEFPNDFLPTYSAMANTIGGVVLLGVEDSDGRLRPVGIQEPERVLKTLWDALNNLQRISRNLLTEDSVRVLDWEGKAVIRVDVPRARREERPVYVGGNPLKGTYRRNFQGDYLCDEEVVRRMLADQVEVSLDSKILEGFDFSDLDPESFKAYRQQFAASKAGHPWLGLNDIEFLKSIGGWAKDRVTGKESLTVAGLLMFGRYEAIRQAIPNYFVDYQERPEPKAEPRWVDRIVPDGTWSGNLYDFVRRVIVKLYADLKVPFVLKDGVRVDQTPVHEALREALINTIIHADFSGQVSILVVKRPDLFGFRNPGTMRVAVDDAIRGGVSDSRNRSLQQMFRYIGLGEQAGSGIPKIYSAWRGQSWRTPVLREKTEPPDFTILELRTVNLLPREVLESLERRFGDRFGRLDETQRLALVTVAIEGEVTHGRLKSMVSDHPSDISKHLAALVREGFLTSHGIGRAMRYFFPDQPPAGIGSLQMDSFLGDSSQHLGESSQHLAAGSQQLPPAPEVKEGSPLWVQALQVGSAIKNKGKVPKAEMQAAIVAIAELGFVTLRDLAVILGRDALGLQNHYLKDLLKTGRLELRYPDKRQHPHQAYRAVRPKS